jgi:hypothetical protein
MNGCLLVAVGPAVGISFVCVATNPIDRQETGS